MVFILCYFFPEHRTGVQNWCIGELTLRMDIRNWKIYLGTARVKEAPLNAEQSLDKRTIDKELRQQNARFRTIKQTKNYDMSESSLIHGSSDEKQNPENDRHSI